MARFTVVKAFEEFIQEFVIEERDDTLGPPGTTRMIMTHIPCETEVCAVDDADTLGDLLVTANNHEC